MRGSEGDCGDRQLELGGGIWEEVWKLSPLKSMKVTLMRTPIRNLNCPHLMQPGKTSSGETGLHSVELLVEVQ